VTQAGAAAPGGVTWITQDGGFDECGLPSISHMQTWWDNSPLFTYGFYVGGRTAAAAGCASGSASRISKLQSQGWSFYPLYDDFQAECNGPATYKMSSNAATAYSQGQASANSAHSAAVALGFATGMVLWLDLEGYNGDATCHNAAKQYVAGWDNQMLANGDKPGVYGSDDISYPTELATASPPPSYFIYARWDHNSTAWGDAPRLANSYWVNDARGHQFSGNRNVTYGGVKLKVDQDCWISLVDGQNGGEYEPGGTSESQGPGEDPTICLK
jgi:hypothetical protein